MTDNELVERARGGDAGAVRELHDRHASLVLSIARRITGDADAARDCAQEVWIRALRFLPTYEGRSTFASWIRTIAARVSLQSDRSDRRRMRREAHFSGMEDGIVHPPEMREGHRLEMALRRLPEGMRRILVLHDVEGFTHEEIGEVLEITSGTSKSQLFKARAKLRGMLSEAVIAGEIGLSDTRAPERQEIERGGMREWST